MTGVLRVGKLLGKAKHRARTLGRNRLSAPLLRAKEGNVSGIRGKGRNGRNGGPVSGNRRRRVRHLRNLHLYHHIVTNVTSTILCLVRRVKRPIVRVIVILNDSVMPNVTSDITLYRGEQGVRRVTIRKRRRDKTRGTTWGVTYFLIRLNDRLYHMLNVRLITLIIVTLRETNGNLACRTTLRKIWRRSLLLLHYRLRPISWGAHKSFIVLAGEQICTYLLYRNNGNIIIRARRVRKTIRVNFLYLHHRLLVRTIRRRLVVNAGAGTLGSKRVTSLPVGLLRLENNRQPINVGGTLMRVGTRAIMLVIGNINRRANGINNTRGRGSTSYRNGRRHTKTLNITLMILCHRRVLGTGRLLTRTENFRLLYLFRLGNINLTRHLGKNRLKHPIHQSPNKSGSN